MVEQARRVLPVRVDAWTVMDMNGPECDLGETVEFILEFREASEGSEECEEAADRTDMTVTVGAWAQEYPGAGEVDPEQMTWNTLLTGDGWSARWDASRPVLGRVRLTGTFHRESLRPHETTVVPTRGSLTRIRTLNGRRGEESWITEGGRIWKSDADRKADTRSFLVDLDLDAASRPEPADLQRPCVVHGFAVTGDAEHRAFWRGDRRLPLVWRTDLASGTTTPVALPLRINDADMYLARVQGPTENPEEDACRVVTVDRHFGRRHFTVSGDGTFVEDDAAPEDSPKGSEVFPVRVSDGMLAVLDPADLSVILRVEVDVWAHAQVDDEATVWVADCRSRGDLRDRLRLFTKDVAGEWAGREVEV
ncbi:hypothetical protein [Corynebacterium variabile]|uniref:hypothetical protein n=1 Tax=Corynebacterium variabile TaxID=1727 RepID=UPI003735D146